MVTFRLNRECRDVAVNPAKVLYVCHYDAGAAQIHFSRECFIRVQGALSEVVTRIEAALSDVPGVADQRAVGQSALDQRDPDVRAH